MRMRDYLLLPFIVSCCLRWATANLRADANANLFLPEDHIVELDEASLVKATATGGEPWMVDFYAPWCGRCQHFAETWKLVAKRLPPGSVKLGAVNCVKQKALCKLHEVSAWPNLRAYNVPGAAAAAAAAGSNDKDTGTLQPDGGVTVREHNLEPLIAWITTRIPAAGAGIGSLPVLDTGPVEPGGGPVDAAAAAAAVAEAAAHLHHPEATAAAGSGSINASRAGSEDAAAGTVAVTAVTDEELCPLRLMDAASSIRFALTNNIFTDASVLSPAKLEALHAFLSLLSRAFPNAAARKSLAALASELRSSTALHDQGNFERYVETAWRFGNFPQELAWPAYEREVAAGVSGSRGGGRAAYSSGLWALFHVLSTSRAEGRPEPAEVMEGVRLFVDNFFGCSECRRHFLTMFHNCDNGRCCIPPVGTCSSPTTAASLAAAERHLALWVWRAHNSVNARLAGAASAPADRSMDPRGYAWPRQERCAACWQGVTDFGPPIWDEDEVYAHLQRGYSCDEAASAALAAAAVAAGIYFGEDDPGGGNEDGGRGMIGTVAVAALLLAAAAVAAVRGWQSRRVGRQKKVADYRFASGGRQPLPSPYVVPEAITSPNGMRKTRFFQPPGGSWTDGHRRRNSSPGINGNGHSRSSGGGGGGSSSGHGRGAAAGSGTAGWMPHSPGPVPAEDLVMEEAAAAAEGVTEGAAFEIGYYSGGSGEIGESSDNGWPGGG